MIEELARRGSRYKESTIRTHVASRMCSDAPDNHAKTFNDLQRVGHGLYKRRGRQTLGALPSGALGGMFGSCKADGVTM